MQIPLDAATIVFAVIAIFVVWKLRSVLGTRVEIERKPDSQSSWRAGLPGAPPERAPSGTQPPPPTPAPVGMPQEVASGDPSLRQGLTEIGAADRSFDPSGFLNGAKGAYGMIVEAFSRGDRKTLSGLLGDDALRTFMASLDERQKSPPDTTSHVESIERADIVRAALTGTTAHVAVRFKARILEAPAVQGGAAGGQTIEANDLWTFARDTRSSDPNWKLVATATEDGHAD